MTLVYCILQFERAIIIPMYLFEMLPNIKKESHMLYSLDGDFMQDPCLYFRLFSPPTTGYFQVLLVLEKYSDVVEVAEK